MGDDPDNLTRVTKEVDTKQNSPTPLYSAILSPASGQKTSEKSIESTQLRNMGLQNTRAAEHPDYHRRVHPLPNDWTMNSEAA